MTLEDDNKNEPETPTNSTVPGVTVTATSSTTPPPTTEESQTQSASPDSPKTSALKQKRSFDEISTSMIVVNEGEPEPGTATAGGVTNGEDEEILCVVESAAMITDDTEVVDSTTTEEGCLLPEIEAPPPMPVTFKVVYAKKPYEVTMDLNGTVADLKEQLEQQTGVTAPMQKLCFRGNLDSSKTLLESGIKDGIKIMLIGSKLEEVKAIDESKPETSTKSVSKEKPSKEPLSQQKAHRKILDKGIPEYATTAWMNDDCALPPEPLGGMVNKYGNKVRLTFKFETDELWIGTKERTTKLPMTNIKSVISEPIGEHPQYHLMGLQVGTTEASRLWFYWVPAQYVKAIRRAIMND